MLAVPSGVSVEASKGLPGLWQFAAHAGSHWLAAPGGATAVLLEDFEVRHQLIRLLLKPDRVEATQQS